MNDNYENEDYISLFQILKVSIGYNLKSKIRFVIVFFVIFIGAVLGLKFGYNNMQYKYTTSFYYDINGFDDNTYFDGTKFECKSLVSKEKLNEIKASDDLYSSIDVDKIYDKDAIKITYDSSEDTTYKYNLTVSKKYFKNDVQAKKFIEDIVNTPVIYTNYVIENINYSTLLKGVNELKTYESELEIYEIQADLIKNKYTELADTYSNYIFKSGESLQNIILKVNIEISNLNISLLKSEYKNNYYVKDYEKNVSDYEIQKETLEKELELTENKIKALQDEIDRQTSSTSMNGLNDQLGALIVLREETKQELELVENYINNGNNNTEAFDAKLKKVCETLESLSETLTENEKELYKNNQNVYYSSSKEVVVAGGFSTILLLVISILIAGIIAVCQNIAIDHKQLVTKKETEKVTIDLNNENKE